MGLWEYSNRIHQSKLSLSYHSVEIVYFPIFMAIRCCVTSERVWYEGIIYLLTIRIADLTGINISFFVYTHIPLLSQLVDV